jgi:hypothetical protein
MALLLFGAGLTTPPFLETRGRAPCGVGRPAHNSVATDATSEVGYVKRATGAGPAPAGECFRCFRRAAAIGSADAPKCGWRPYCGASARANVAAAKAERLDNCIDRPVLAQARPLDAPYFAPLAVRKSLGGRELRKLWEKFRELGNKCALLRI